MKSENLGRVVELRTVEDQQLALVELGGARWPVFVDTLSGVKVGDFVKVLGGCATERVEEPE